MSLATDPETGESRAREVVATLPHTDQLLTLRTSSGVIVTIEDHPLLESGGSGAAGVPGPRLVISPMSCCPNRCPFGKSGEHCGSLSHVGATCHDRRQLASRADGLLQAPALTNHVGGMMNWCAQSSATTRTLFG